MTLFRLLLMGSMFLFPQITGARQSSAPLPKSAAGKPPAQGAVINGVYHHPWFGFSYKIPAGWVERTEQMSEDASDAAKARLLLAVFERPPEVSDEGVNPGVVVAAESTNSYPGLKSPVDYFLPLSEVVAAKGFAVTKEPYEFTVEGHKLVRGDFQKQLPSSVVYQSSLAEIVRGFIVSFTFIGESEDEIDGLIEHLGFRTSSPRKGTS